MTLLRTLTLRGKQLPSNVWCAPLAGCSDLPFREMTAHYQPGLMFCEMVKMEPLLRCDPITRRMLDRTPAMGPIGAQLCGSKPELAGLAAKIIEDLGFDVVDLNCGCPVDKVTKDGSGSGLLKHPEKIAEIVSQMVQAVSIPVTVKIRIGWDHGTLVGPEVVELVEAAGASAITVHGRTRSQGYQGRACRTTIAACKARSQTIPVIANGDIFTAEDAVAMLQETGCDGLLLARGTMGAPWIIEEVKQLLAGGTPLPKKTPEEVRASLLDHLARIEGYQVERKALLDTRRVCCYYLKELKGVKALREAINRSPELAQVYDLIQQFSWEGVQVGVRSTPEELSCENCVE